MQPVSGQTGTAPSEFAIPTAMAPGAGSSFLGDPSYQPPPSVQQPSTGQSYQPLNGQPYPSSSGYLPPGYAPTSMVPPPYAAPPPPAPQLGTNQGLASIRRAFAGRGTLVMHHSWLLEGVQAQAVGVRFAAKEVLRKRNIAGLGVAEEKLMERGIFTEERDYLSLRRGITTVFLQASPIGQDLYISRATTVLPAISMIRVAIYATLLLIMIIGLLVPSPFLGGSFGYQSNIFTTLSGLFAYPILLFFIWQLARSFISWLIEKDFWFLLRPETLNDFQLDDIAFLEHLTDDTVREAAKQLNLDSAKIIPPPLWYQPKSRIRSGSLFFGQTLS